MDNRVLMQKYEILDTLFTNELQTVYIGKDISNEELGKLIINEFRDVDIIYSMKDSLSPERSKYLENLVESFYVDFNFYVIGKICPGTTLESFLSNNSLRLTEKMYITENLLIKLVEIDTLSPLLKYALLDCNNISIVNKKNICLNCNLQFSKETVAVAAKDVYKRVGEIICAVFVNSIQSETGYDKDYLPPAMLPIIQKCNTGHYKAATELYNDFKALLIHSIFINNMSVDSQIRKNLKKAKMRKRLSPIRKLVAAVLILAVLGGLWTLSDRYLFNKSTDVGKIVQQTNTKPKAKFAASKSKVYEGEQVIFVNQSTDSDINDFIKSYKWAIHMNGELVTSSSNQNLAYEFDTAGKYAVTLTVKDSKGEASDDYKYMVEVLPKPVVPTTNNPNSNNPNVVK